MDVAHPESLGQAGPPTPATSPRDRLINAVSESDKADNRMRVLAIAHKKIVLERLATLCTEASLKEPDQVAHSLGLIIDGAIVAALVTRDSAVAETASRTCASVLSAAR